MKENFLGLGKWLVVGGVLLGIGGLLVFGLGRRRGTRSYRWRMAMWSLVIGLVGGGTLFVSSCSSIIEPMCYDPLMEDTGKTASDTTPTDVIAPPDTHEEEQRILCYAPRMPDEIEQPGPDMTVMCYAEVPPPDVVMCYGDIPEPDSVQVVPDANEEPEILVTCYKMIPDIVEDNQEEVDTHEDKDAVTINTDLMMCYFAGDPPE